MTTTSRRAHPGGPALALKAAALSLLVLATTSGSALAESAAAYMQRVANQLIAAQREGGENDYATVLRSHADVPAIAITALGSYAQSLAKSDRPAYYAGMINFIANYASREGPKFPVARAVMTGQTQETAKGIYIDSRVTLVSGDVYDVRWLIVRRGSAFKVREAEVLGFEMTTFLDTAFQNYIGANGGDPRSLVVALNR
ncbi:MAG: ABC transporter substrate-binding protein [Hyphomicrobium sp.]|uniref:ABC transporter substrate-binding protein n=1 Tax=Hyphomicrobium sp. TaxID=82 RepID=UPI003D09F38F